MKKSKSIVASVYGIMITAVLPIYMKDGFHMIGDAKYEFFRNVSIALAAATLVLVTAGLINEVKGRMKAGKSARGGMGSKGGKNSRGAKDSKGAKSIHSGKDSKGAKSAHPGKDSNGGEEAKAGVAEQAIKLSYAELFAVFFAVTGVLSSFFSAYPQTVLWGYMDWHMGLVSQLLFVLGFFVMGRWAGGDKVVLPCAWLSALLICMLTISNRCGDDPLGVYTGMDWFDWNRRNLVATIGNINWLCCYLAVSVPLLLWFFWKAKGRIRLLGLIGAFVGIAAMMLQGSAAGFVDVAVTLVILLWFSLEDRDKLIRFFDIAALIPLFWSIFSIFQIDLITPADANVKNYYSVWWLLPLAILAGIDGVLRLRQKAGKTDLLAGIGATESAGKSSSRQLEIKTWCRTGILVIFGIGAALFVGCQFSDALWQLLGGFGVLRIDDNWGSFRGLLWKTALQMYGSFDGGQMLYGVGPDCFAYAFQKIGTQVAASGQWADAVYANAHNEILTMLVNEGVLGVLSYIGIFGCTLYQMAKNYRRSPLALPGILMVAGYLTNGVFAFQQAVSTPYIFVMMGLILTSCDKIE